MFDFDAGKLLIIGIVALVFIPSKDLPRVLRQLGQFVSKMRRMASEFQGQFMDAMREADMAELRKEADKLAKAASIDVGFDPIHDLKTQVNAALDSKPALAASDAESFAAASHAADSEPARSIAPPELAVQTEVTGDLVEASGVVQIAEHGNDAQQLTSLELARKTDRDEAIHSVAHGG